MAEFLFSPAGIPCVLALMFVVFVVGMAKQYKRVGPDEALVVTGGKSGLRIVTGGGTFVFPIFEKSDRVCLAVIAADLPAQRLTAAGSTTITLAAATQAAVGRSDLEIRTAARQFPGKGPDEIRPLVLRALESRLRSAAASMTADEIRHDHDAFTAKVQALTTSDLENLGLHLISLALYEPPAA